MTGASSASASARTASAARRAPPPAHTIGACACVEQLAHARHRRRIGPGQRDARDRAERRPAHAAAITSVAISIVAGPGSSAMWANASATAAASASGVVGPGVEPRHGGERLRLAPALVQVAAAGADEVGRDLRREVEHRRARRVGLRERGERVERPRPGRRQVDARLLAGARIADRSEPGRLLVAHDDPAHRRADQRVPDRESVDARQPEHHLDVVGLERLDEDVGSGAHGGRRDGHAGGDYFWEAEMNATRSSMSDADERRPERRRHDAVAVPRGRRTRRDRRWTT